MSNGLRYRSAVPGDSDPCPRSRCVDQLSLTTRTSVRVLEISTICPWLLTIRSEGPWCGPAVWEIRARVLVPMRSIAVTDDSCPGLRDRRFNPLCWTSCTWVRVLAVSTSSPGRLVPTSEGLQVRPEFLGDSGPCPSTRGVDQLSRVTRARFQSPAVLTCFPGHIGPLSKAHGFDQMSLATWPLVRGAAGSTSCPG